MAQEYHFKLRFTVRNVKLGTPPRVDTKVVDAESEEEAKAECRRRYEDSEYRISNITVIATQPC